MIMVVTVAVTITTGLVAGSKLMTNDPDSFDIGQTIVQGGQHSITGSDSVRIV